MTRDNGRLRFGPIFGVQPGLEGEHVAAEAKPRVVTGPKDCVLVPQDRPNMRFDVLEMRRHPRTTQTNDITATGPLSRFGLLRE